MSLITRCPACQTLFKVVPDQLRISDGWVRCGMCDEIFDAASHAQLGPSTQPEPAVELIEEPVAPSPGPLPGVQVSARRNDTGGLNGAAQAEDKVETGEAAPAHGGIAAAVSVADIELPDVGNLAELDPVDAASAPVESEVDAEGVAVKSHAENETANDEPLLMPDPVVSFMKGSVSQSVWQKTSIRAALALVSLGLLFGLAIQVVVHERNRIAGSLPQMRSALTTLCASLDCVISPPKQIESIVIESSAFTRIRGDVYRLSFAVKNTSSIELAVPALELTLTDAQDQAVMRKILTHTDLSAPFNVLAPESDWVGAISVSVRSVTGSGADRIAGYRVLAFYP